jgi:hypothetical protein
VVETLDLSDRATMKRLALGWRSSLAGAGHEVEDIEQAIVLAQLEFDAGLRKQAPGENIGALYCQLAGDRQISVGGTRSRDGEDALYLSAIGVGIEHIDPAMLLEISQCALEIEPVAHFNEIAASDLAAVLGVSVRQARNIRKTLSQA